MNKIFDSIKIETKPTLFVAILLICLGAASAFTPLLASSYPQKITTIIQGITFDSNYDNGSLEQVTAKAADEFDCTIYEESGEMGTRQYWFRFKLSGVAGRTITLNINHYQNPRPVISLDGKNWRRLTAQEAPDRYTMILSFNSEQNEAELAFFYPSGVEETYRTTNEYVRRCDNATSEVIGPSFQGREMWMVTVTDPTTSDTQKHRVWMHSRAHAGEVPSTLAMLGFIDLITSDSPLGRHLRRNCIFNVIPLENIDGTFLGHTRWDSQGIDPERQWGNPSRIPETANMQKKVDAFMAGDNPIEVALNMHSTVGNPADTFFFKHLYPSVSKNFEVIQQRYINALDNATDLFDNLSAGSSQLNPTIFIESYFWNNWGEAVMAMTHEGHYYKRITDGDWITDSDYHELGGAMAEALIEYFNLPPVPEEIPGFSWTFY